MRASSTVPPPALAPARLPLARLCACWLVGIPYFLAGGIAERVAQSWSHAQPSRPLRLCLHPPQVAVVLPLQSVLPQFGPLPEPALAAALGAATLATTLNINGAELFNAALLTVGWDPEAAAAALPGTLAFLAILGELLLLLLLLLLPCVCNLAYHRGPCY